MKPYNIACPKCEGYGLDENDNDCSVCLDELKPFSPILKGGSPKGRISFLSGKTDYHGAINAQHIKNGAKILLIDYEGSGHMEQNIKNLTKGK